MLLSQVGLLTVTVSSKHVIYLNTTNFIVVYFKSWTFAIFLDSKKCGIVQTNALSDLNQLHF